MGSSKRPELGNKTKHGEDLEREIERALQIRARRRSEQRGEVATSRSPSSGINI
jgi:hypothetical protein